MSNVFAYRTIFVILAVLVLNYLWYYRGTSIFKKYETPISNNTDQCHIPEWNRVETQSITNSFWNTVSRLLWMALDLSKENNQNYTSLALIGAYVYPESISITLNTQYMAKQRLFCRYFDCKTREIPGSEWEGVVFPESVIQCPRRIGAEFVSVSRTKEEEPVTPMRLLFRDYSAPIHELAICVAPLYGSEPKWLQIVEFIEHHKMEGATMFYFHIGNISDYDRKVLDDYENKGEIEVKVFQEKNERPFYAWQLIEIQDCHNRAKYHSKWTAFIDIDERISTKNGNILEFLRIEDVRGNLGEIQMPILNIPKYENAPEKYESEEQVKREMISKKYQKSPGTTWDASKALIRPDKIGIMSIHYAIALEHGYSTLRTDASKIVLRHYRSTQNRENGNNWDQGKTLYDSPLPMEFSEELTKKVVGKVKDIYEKVPVNCSTIPEEMWKSRQFPNPCERMLLTW